MIIQAKVRKLERFYILIIFNQVQTNFKSPYLLLYMPYYHISVRRDTISLFLPLTILMSNVILKTGLSRDCFNPLPHDSQAQKSLLGLPKKDRVSPIFQLFIFSHSVLRMIKVNFK